MDTALSAASCVLAVPVSHTTPSLSVSTWMRPMLVIWSAASLALILAVMAESLTNAEGCERSVSESWATEIAVKPNSVPNTRQTVASFAFIIYILFINRHDYHSCLRCFPFVAAPTGYTAAQTDP